MVSTPAGDVIVRGTCFRVEVRDPMKPSKQHLVSGAIGAAAATVVMVAVYEGRVVLASEKGQVELAAGQQGTAVAGRAPRVIDEAEASAAAPSDLTALRADNARLARRVAELEKAAPSDAKLAAAEAQLEGLLEAMGHTSAFKDQARDPAWAPAQESAMQDRLTRHLGVKGAKVECRTSCCQVTFREGGEPTALWEQLDSAVGFRDGSSTTTGYTQQSGDDGIKRVTKGSFCFDRDKQASAPDRAAERERLLAKARPALRACAARAAVPFVLRVQLSLDATGAVKDVSSSADEIPDDAADCAVAAISDAAAFAPAPEPTRVPIEVRLDPADP